MKTIKTLLTLCLVSLLLLIGCQSENIEQENKPVMENSEQSMVNEGFEISEASTQEETTGYSIKTLKAENCIGEEYYWVILQNGRKTMTQAEVQEINDRLHEKGLKSNISFHIVTIDEYITPEVLKNVYEQLGNQMDFVSLAPGLCGFDMSEWKENFIELSDELQNGKLNQFYTTVPAKVWEANQIDDGIYSFSNTTDICLHGYGFWPEAQEKYGVENLLKLQEANGLENETIWQELYELHQDSPCYWATIYGGISGRLPENPYERDVLEQFTNRYEQQFFVSLTDEIRFDIEKNEFVWLPESDKYNEIKQRVFEFYQKGYFELMPSMKEDLTKAGPFSAKTAKTNKVLLCGKETDELWVPSWKESRVSKDGSGYNYMYSLVYYKAKTGWQELLNLMGSDERIIDLLHPDYYHMVISILRYGEPIGNYTPRIEDRYEMLEAVYEEAEADPLAGFIFNPVPIQEEWEEYNKMAALLADINVVVYPNKEGGVGKPNFEAIDKVFAGYRDIKEKAHIELILEEVNRQYAEWKEKQ